MQNFKATLIRERFAVTPVPPSNTAPPPSRGNRLDFECTDATGTKPARFVVRAQNIHTTLRIAAHIAWHWYEFGHLNETGTNRFNWKQVYNETVKDFEEKWNPECWAGVYRNGQKLFQSNLPDKVQIFDIIEQVYAYSKGNYADIARDACNMFIKAGKSVEIDYDGDLAMDLTGSSEQVINRITYRDTDGKNQMDLVMQQKDLKHIKGKGAPIKLSECLSVAAVVFEGYQLGFCVGRTNYQLASGQLTIGAREAQQADHAIKRVLRLEKALENLSQKHHLLFKPKPNFQKNIMQIENSFRKKSIRD